MDRVLVLFLFWLAHIDGKEDDALPGWSTDVAEILVDRAQQRGLALDQSQVQQLVYIAHGLRLATSGEALTGDRPEAWVVGPIYTRLARLLASVGTGPVVWEKLPLHAEHQSVRNGLETPEIEVVHRVVESYGKLDANKLAILTCGPGSPWRQVYAAGSGPRREISHALMKAHFEQFGDQALRHRHADR